MGKNYKSIFLSALIFLSLISNNFAQDRGSIPHVPVPVLRELRESMRDAGSFRTQSSIPEKNFFSDMSFKKFLLTTGAIAGFGTVYYFHSQFNKWQEDVQKITKNLKDLNKNFLPDKSAEFTGRSLINGILSFRRDISGAQLWQEYAASKREICENENKRAGEQKLDAENKECGEKYPTNRVIVQLLQALASNQVIVFNDSNGPEECTFIMSEEPAKQKQILRQLHKNIKIRSSKLWEEIETLPRSKDIIKFLLEDVNTKYLFEGRVDNVSSIHRFINEEQFNATCRRILAAKKTGKTTFDNLAQFKVIPVIMILKNMLKEKPDPSLSDPKNSYEVFDASLDAFFDLVKIYTRMSALNDILADYFLTIKQRDQQKAKIGSAHFSADLDLMRTRDLMGSRSALGIDDDERMDLIRRRIQRDKDKDKE